MTTYEYPTKEKLRNMLDDLEDNFIERKQNGVSDRDIRRTLVAFANSVPEGRIAVLFIGVAPDGARTGVGNPDKFQMKVSRICDDCYPEIKHKSEVLNDDNGVIAVIVPHSFSQPHFSGRAFVREGSESRNASEELYEEMISYRNSKVCEILKWKDRPVTLIREGEHDNTISFRDFEQIVTGCTSHSVQLRVDGYRNVSIPLEDIKIAIDTKRDNRLKLIMNSGVSY